MNLISFDNIYQKTDETKDFFFLHEWRKEDYKKIPEFLHEMFAKIKKLDPEFEYDIQSSSNISTYLGDNASYYDNYVVNQKYKTHEKSFNFLVPKLLQGNYFILNNALYIPLLFLEKAPIDRVTNDDYSKNKIYANVSPIYNFTFDFTDSKAIYFKNKKIDMDLFLKVVFDQDKEKLDYFKEIGLIEETYLTSEKVDVADKRKLMKYFGFQKESFFDHVDIAQWIDDYLIMNFHHDLFYDYYGIRGIKEITLKIIEFYQTGEVIDMANIANRRVVMSEYLIKALFELYFRLLTGIINKKGQNFLPTINPNVMLTSGFNQMMHRGNLYDISIPFPSPLINKISQDISIITDGRLPKSWVRNDESAFGIFCPITVGAQKTSSNIVFTLDSMINKFGRIKINEGAINEQ